MDKQTFYHELSARLNDLGIGQNYIERHMKQFDAYFMDKTDDEVEHEIERLGDINRVAARIKRMTDKIIEQELSSQSTESDVNQREMLNAEEGNVTHRTDEANASKVPEEDNTSITHDCRVDGNLVVEADTDTISDNVDAMATGEEEPVYEDEDIISFTPLSDQNNATVFQADECLSVDDETLIDSKPHYMGKTRGAHNVTDPGRIIQASPDDITVRRNTRKFWGIFALTFPITLAVLTVTAAAFATLFFLIAVLIISFVAALVAITAIGTLVSVFGIIFGVALMMTNLPIGLYECGIAIIVGAAAMFIGILLYNVAVRLLPFASRWLLVLFRLVYRKYKELFVYLKKECIGL